MAYICVNLLVLEWEYENRVLKAEHPCKQDNHATVSCMKRRGDGRKSNLDVFLEVDGSIFFIDLKHPKLDSVFKISNRKTNMKFGFLWEIRKGI